MSEHWEDWKKQIANKYPLLFEKVGYLDFSGPKGWAKLIDDLCAKLNPIVASGQVQDFQIDQIKEKFGGLRFYVSGMTKEGYEYIVEAENAAHHICQSCGNPGKGRSVKGWIATLCEACFSKKENDNESN